MAKSTAPKTPKAPPSPLPKALVAQVPSSARIAKLLNEIESATASLAKEMATAKKRGAIGLAQAFVVLHRIKAVCDDKVKPLSQLFEQYKVTDVPEVLETAGVTSVPLDVGYRVTVAYRTSATIPAENKAAAFEWLRQNHPDVLVETVNASTLSALAKQLSEEKNQDLPPSMFKVAEVPQTSVTKT